MTISRTHLLAGLTAAGFALPAAGQPPESTRDLTIEQAPIAAIEAPASDLAVTIALDRADARYSAGEPVVFDVTVNEDAYVTILDIGTSGRAHVIFPNAYAMSNKLAAHEPLTIPAPEAGYAITAQPPAGIELVKVFASPSQDSLIDALEQSEAGPFRALEGTPRVLARALERELGEPAHEGWAESQVRFEIVVDEAPGAAGAAAPE